MNNKTKTPNDNSELGLVGLVLNLIMFTPFIMLIASGLDSRVIEYELNGKTYVRQERIDYGCKYQNRFDLLAGISSFYSKSNPDSLEINLERDKLK